MSFAPFSFLNLFSLASFKGLNWFEGLKRIKVFLQWLWGVPSALVFVYVALCWNAELGAVLLGLLAVVLPIIGFELLFRAIVWIVAGFMQAGDSNTEAIKMAEAHQPNELKKKVIRRFSSWIDDLKKAKPRDFCDAVFFVTWIYLWTEFVGNSWLNPLGNWQTGALSHCFDNFTVYSALYLFLRLSLTIFKGLLATILAIGGFVIYGYLAEIITKRIDLHKTTKN